MSTPLLQKIGFSPSFRHRQLAAFLLVSLTFTLPLVAQVQKLKKEDYFSKGTVTAGNGIYRVSLENILGEGVGLYAISTGPRHPITRANNNKLQDLLVGGSSGEHGRPGTSYTTIRSYTSTTDYVQSEFAARPDTTPYGIFEPFWLDGTFINDDSIVAENNYLTPIKKIFFSENGGRDTLTTGYTVTYKLPSLANPLHVRDQMVITEKIEVHGTDFGDSWVEITTIVKNIGPEAIEIGIRYFWDLNVGGDDGPELFEQTFNTSLGKREAGIGWINFAHFKAEGMNTSNGKPVDFNVYGTALTPTNLLRVPLQPTRLQQASWLRAFFNAFDYSIDPSLNITVQGDPKTDQPGGDSAVQFFWGETLDNAITIKTGDSVQVTQGLFASPSDGKPTLYDLALPTCEVTKRQFEPAKRFELLIQDEISGLRRVQVENLFNAKIEVPDFKTGATEPIPIVVTAIDEAAPVGFIVRAVDLSGNLMECSPTFQTLKPGLDVHEYRLNPLFSDRYFYIKNQGVRRIAANLNGNEFILSAEPEGTSKTGNIFSMPVNGEMTIDVAGYLKEKANTMTIAYEGPQGSRTDLAFSNVPMKSGIDLVLNLASVPVQFALSQNLPNPFQGVTTIHFEAPAAATNPGSAGKVELKIYNLLGQVVRTLVDGNVPAGSYNINWDGRDENGRLVAAGVYLYNLTADQTRITKKMALLR